METLGYSDINFMYLPELGKLVKVDFKLEDRAYKHDFKSEKKNPQLKMY